MTTEKIALFRKSVLKGQECPEDLEHWLNNPDCCLDILEKKMGYRLLHKPETSPLLSHSYLNDNDRKDPDTIANVKAINAVFAYITFVVEHEDCAVIGYWHGPQSIDIKQSPIVKINTEGEFLFLEGTTLTEALIAECCFDDDESFLEKRGYFQSCGLKIKAMKYDELTNFTPCDIHTTLYQKFKKEAELG